MISYKKIIFFFLKINAHRSVVKNKIPVKRMNLVFYFYNKRANLDLNQTLKSLYSVLFIFNIVNSKKGDILFVGNKILNFFSSSFLSEKSKKQNLFFVPKWVGGLVSNWVIVKSFFIKQNVFKSSYKMKSIRRLRFIKFFSVLINLKKPALIIIFNSSSVNEIILECSNENVPVIVFSEIDLVINFNCYSVFTNCNRIQINWFLLQLFLLQNKKINL